MPGSLTERPHGTLMLAKATHTEPNTDHSRPEVGQPDPGRMFAGHHSMWRGGVATGQVLWAHYRQPSEEEADNEQENPSNRDRNPGSGLPFVTQRNDCNGSGLSWEAVCHSPCATIAAAGPGARASSRSTRPERRHEVSLKSVIVSGWGAVVGSLGSGWPSCPRSWPWRGAGPATWRRPRPACTSSARRAAA